MHPNELLLAILGVFFTFRVAQFIAYDDAPFALMKKARQYCGKKAAGSKEHGFWWSLAELINCPYCNGIWIALVITLTIQYSYQWNFFLIWGAIAGGQAWLESMTGTR